ncbi:MAG: WbuC family cupin fold metalloprotein [Candidatus Methylacidiphilales bacterium]
MLRETFSVRALDPPTESVFFLEESRLQQAIVASRQNARGRIMLPIQRSESAPVQRLLNIMQPGSYVPPHRHPRPQSIELALVLRGALQVWVFDDAGVVTHSRLLRPGSEPALVDMEPNVWHTFAAQEQDTVLLEIKGGPYDAEHDKVFAPWAPREGDPAAPAYLQSLMDTLVKA